MLLMHILKVNGVLTGCGCKLLIEDVYDFACICEFLFTIFDDRGGGGVLYHFNSGLEDVPTTAWDYWFFDSVLAE